MPVLAIAIICLLGLSMYLYGTAAADAALVLTCAAAFYVGLTAFLMRE